MELQGIEPTLRVIDPATDSGLLCIILGSLVVNAFVFPTLLRLWRLFFKQLIRPHSDMMQAERTINERAAMVISLLQTVIMEGLILYCTFASQTSDMPHAAVVASFCGVTALAAILLVAQLGAYCLIGFAFSTAAATQAWIRSFLATQSLAGYLLIIPALGGIFYPAFAGTTLTVCIIVFCLCRILFYIRSFAFFYTSPASLLYFFLYLCTVEIVPLSVVWSLKGLFFNAFL